jgi:hypothetical protein
LRIDGVILPMRANEPYVDDAIWVVDPHHDTILVASDIEYRAAVSLLDVVEGMQFDRGYISPYFITNADKMRVEMEDPYILINEKKLSALNELPRMLAERMSRLTSAGVAHSAALTCLCHAITGSRALRHTWCFG